MVVISLILNYNKKQRSDHQKLTIKIKATIFEISTPNFLCKFSIPKNPSIPILEQNSSHLLKKNSLLVTYLSPVANLMEHPLTAYKNFLFIQKKKRCSHLQPLLVSNYPVIYNKNSGSFTTDFFWTCVRFISVTIIKKKESKNKKP